LTGNSTRGRPRFWQAAAGIAVSIVLLWWTLHDVDFHQVWGNIRAARPGPVLLGVLLATIPFGLRVFRWRLLLRREDGSALPAAPLWHAIAIGFMANNTLPLRMGELIRALAASRLTGVRLTAALASLAVERLMDVLVVVLLLGVGLLLAGLPAGTTIAGVRLASLTLSLSVVALAGLGVAALMVAFPRTAESAIRRVIPWPGLADRLAGLVEGVAQGMSALQSPSRVAAVIAWSLIIWLVNAASFYVMFGAFGIGVDFAGALVLQGAIMFVIAVPSSPGYFGAFEVPVVAVLALFLVAKSDAVSYAFTYHLTTFVPITLLGLWSVARTGFGLREVRAATT
jgi:uncharacterized protein (TIRG00374 family)